MTTPLHHPPATGGPIDRRALSGVLTGVAFLAGVGGAAARARTPYPRPWADPHEVRDYFAANADAAKLSATGQLISAASLVPFTASIARLATRPPRSSTAWFAAIAGGSVASVALATSAGCAAALSGRRGKDPATAARLHRRGFEVGGPVHGVGFGMLCAGLGVAALRTGALPRSVALTALCSAAPGMLSPLYFVARPAGWLIPAGRFPGLIAIGVAGWMLARRR